MKLENVKAGQEFKITSGFFSRGHDNPNTVWTMKGVSQTRRGDRNWKAQSYHKVWNGQKWVKEMIADSLVFYSDQAWEIEVELV